MNETAMFLTLYDQKKKKKILYQLKTILFCKKIGSDSNSYAISIIAYTRSFQLLPASLLFTFKNLVEPLKKKKKKKRILTLRS